MSIESRNKRCPDSAAVLHVRLFALHRHAKVDTRNAVPIAEVALSVFETTTPPLFARVFTVLIKLDPASHWLAGQIAGIHLFTVAGGMAIGAAAVLLYHSIGRIAGVSGIFFTGIKEGGLWRGLFLGCIVVGTGPGAYFFPR
jgi:hypothetical protein